MIKIESTYSTINLSELRELKLWASYTPKKYNEKASLEYINTQKIKDQKVLNNLNKLEVFLSQHISPDDFEEDKINIGALEEKDYNYLAKLIKSLPRLNIGNYWYKFSEEEYDYCMNFVKEATLENSEAIKQEILKVPNYFLKHYAYYLLLHHPESNYEFSITSVSKHVSSVSKKLVRKMDDIRKQEIHAWETARNRY